LCVGGGITALTAIHNWWYNGVADDERQRGLKKEKELLDAYKNGGTFEDKSRIHPTAIANYNWNALQERNATGAGAAGEAAFRQIGNGVTAGGEVAMAALPMLQGIRLARVAAALTSDISQSFTKGEYIAAVLQEDMVVYRYSGGISSPAGRWLTTADTVAQINSPAAAQKILNLPAGATATQLNSWVIPKGTTVYYGGVAGGGKAARQVFIQDSSVLRAAP
jgi:hypothetical protein